MRHLGWLMVTILTPGFSVAARAERELSVDEVIATIEAAEDRNVRFIYSFEFNSLKLADGNDPASVVETRPTFVRGTVYYDVPTGKYLFETESVSKWVDGAAPFIAERSGWSYDGRVYRHWHRTRHGQTLPTLDEQPLDVEGAPIGPLVGEITTAQDAAGFVRALTHESGLNNFPPFVNMVDKKDRPLVTLAEELRDRQQAGQTIRVVEETNGSWRLSFRRRSNERDEIRLWVDPARAFAVTKIEWAEVNMPPPGVWMRLHVALREAAPGRWVPEELNLVEVVSKYCQRIRLSNIELNPPLTDDDFRVRFPLGTQVDDFIEEKSYRVSAGPIAEAQAVQEFILRHKGTLQPVAKSPKPATWQYWLVGVNLIALATASLILWRQRRKAGDKRSAAGSGSKSLVMLLPLCALIPGANAAEFKPQQGWTTGHSPGEELAISQCGFNVAVFALEMCGAKYAPEPLAAALRPNRDGIVMSDLKTALEACGLHVEARADVRVSDLERSLGAQHVAIIPLRFRDGHGHYVAAIRGQDGRILLADPPRSLAVADAALYREQPLSGPRPMLFVSPRVPEAPELASSVQVWPAVIELGEFVVNDPAEQAALKVEVKLRNVSSTPVLVNAVKSSCGCTSTGWEGGILAPQESRAIALNVRRISWGEGLHRRSLTIEFADGSRRQVVISGTGRRATVHVGMKLITSRVVQTLEFPRYLPDLEEFDIPLFGDTELNESLEIASVPSWLVVTKASDRPPRLRASIELDQHLLQTLICGSRRLSGTIQIIERKRNRVQEITTEMVLPTCLQVSPRVLALAPGETIPIRLESSSPDTQIQSVRLLPSPRSDLHCEVLDLAPSHAVITCRAAADATTGIAVIACEVDCGKAIPDRASFVARIMSEAAP